MALRIPGVVVAIAFLAASAWGQGAARDSLPASGLALALGRDHTRVQVPYKQASFFYDGEWPHILAYDFTGALEAYYGDAHGVDFAFGTGAAYPYSRESTWAVNTGADRERLKETLPLFRKYARQYNFDEFLLVAQGYQESQLDQATQSGSGAIGVMQIKPSTASGDPINIRDVKGSTENNIHAGAKYLRHLADDYFNEPGLSPFNQHLFALAAYNAGPTRIQSLRRKAKAQGLNPDIWFNNVEVVSAQTIGRHNPEYVRNVLSYWVAYRQAAELEEALL